MGISNHLKIVNTAFEEFKVFVVQQATLHPIAAVALAILFPVAIVGSCVWGIRKIIILNKSNINSKQTELKLQNKKLEVDIFKGNQGSTNNAEDSTSYWQKKYLALGGLAVFGIGMAIYCMRQSPANFVTVITDGVKDSASISIPLQSSIVDFRFLLYVLK